ncbi:MAG TPA: PQQ-binding-like beta-propeller repeat protein [Candidatus Saccharimonadales bacterium]|nr:PQQ-binding-like beta-propeller repeat protein [Candidatus Saccharimonadales bacterium]
MRNLTLLTALVLAAPAMATDAPMFRGNLEHTGTYAGSGVAQFSKVKWKFQTKGSVISSPAIVAGVAYFGSVDGNLYAVDLASGAQKWKFPTPSRVNSSPAVDGGVVFFGSYDGAFYAVDAATGGLKWKFKTDGERRFAGKRLHGSQPVNETMPDPFDCYLSSPSVAAGAVYFGSGDGNIYSLDAASGRLNWKFQTGDVVHASPAIADGTVFIGSWDSFFYAIDAASGREKWRFKTGEDNVIHNQVGIQSSATVADGVVYFGCRDSNLYALAAKTGQKKWAFNNKGSWVITSPAVRDGKVYFGTSDTSLFYVVDAQSGTSLASLKAGGWPIFASPAIAGNFAYLGTQDGKLTALDLTAGKTAWSFQTDASRENLTKFSKPGGGPDYAAAFADDFYDSMIVGVAKMYATGSILSSPVVVDNVIYFGSTDGNLYALQ